MAWVLRLVDISAEGEERCADVMPISRPDSLVDLASLGLTLDEGKQLLAGLQREIVTAQARVHAARRPACRSCGTACRVKDYRQHAIATLFGQATVRLPRFRCAGCGATEAGVTWPPHIRSTSELDRLQAQFSALMTYRTAAALLGQVLPVDAGRDPETLRRRTFKVAEALPRPAALKAVPAAEVITLTLDSTFIRSCAVGERHLEVRIGNVETATGGRQVFGAVARVDTDLAALIRGNLDAVGRTATTALTAFTDGCAALRRSLLEAGIDGLTILDWFHLAMRLQHLTQIAGNLSSDTPERAAAKAVIVEEAERLRWRLWNGKAQDAQISLERIQAVMPAFRGGPDSRRSVAPSRKLWTALEALDAYLVGQRQPWTSRSAVSARPEPVFHRPRRLRPSWLRSPPWSGAELLTFGCVHTLSACRRSCRVRIHPLSTFGRGAEQPMRVLLVESDLTLARGLSLTLRSGGAIVDHSDTGAEALELARHYDYDIVLLDLMLPDMEGYEVIRRMRAARIEVPVLVLSALSSPQAKVKAFGAGADDFLCKPFDKTELLARMQAVLRRSKGYSQPTLRVGDVVLNLDSREVTVAGTPVELTNKEYSVLELLVLRKGMVLTKEAFLNHLYGGMDEPEMKIIDVFICKLRKKLGQAGVKDLISTVWGRGYMVREPSGSGLPATAAGAATAGVLAAVA